MKHRATPRFWKLYESLPKDVQQLADRCYSLLKNDPHHPSLQFKRIRTLWSVRVGLHYRALAVREDEEVAWFWIGPHADYDSLVAR